MPRDPLLNAAYVGNMSNSEVITRHLSWLRRATDRRATLKHRHDNLQRLANALPVDLLDATPEHLDAWQAGLTVSMASVHTYTCHTRAFYTWAAEHGLCADNPAKNLPVPRLPRRLPRPIPENDLRLALKCATGDMLVWLALAGWCGLRAEEIAKLRGEDVITDEGDTLLRVDGKGGKERIVPVPTEVVRLITVRRGPLFKSPSGKPATGNYVSHTASVFFEGLGLPYTLHQLRHRFGTQLYQLCKDIRLVQDVMGHASPATTASYVAIARKRSKPIDRLGRSLQQKAS